MILTLCGSARFESYYHEANKLLGLAGHISFALMTYPSIEGGNKSWYTEDQKWTLDLAHFAKIQASHGSVFLNIDNYLGESSLRELKWTRMQGKSVFWVNLKDNPYFHHTDFPVVGSLIEARGNMRWGDDWTDLLERVKKKLENAQVPEAALTQIPVSHQQV